MGYHIIATRVVTARYLDAATTCIEIEFKSHHVRRAALFVEGVDGVGEGEINDIWIGYWRGERDKKKNFGPSLKSI